MREVLTAGYFYYIHPNKMHMLQSLFYLTTALHVSSVIITHRHHSYISNHMKTKTDQYATHTHSNQFQLFHDSNRQQYGMYIIHYSTEHIAFSAEYTLSTTIVILIQFIGTL